MYLGGNSADMEALDWTTGNELGTYQGFNWVAIGADGTLYGPGCANGNAAFR